MGELYAKKDFFNDKINNYDDPSCVWDCRAGLDYESSVSGRVLYCPEEAGSVCWFSGDRERLRGRHSGR